MLAIISAAAFLAVEPETAPPLAAPLKIDVEAMQAGQLPAVGTLEEADACAAETKHVVVLILSSGKVTAQAAAQATVPAVKWMKRAAALRSIDVTAYSNDKDVRDAERLMTYIPLKTQAVLQRTCIDRLVPVEGK